MPFRCYVRRLLQAPSTCLQESALLPVSAPTLLRANNMYSSTAKISSESYQSEAGDLFRPAGMVPHDTRKPQRYVREGEENQAGSQPRA